MLFCFIIIEFLIGPFSNPLSCLLEFSSFLPSFSSLKKKELLEYQHSWFTVNGRQFQYLKSWQKGFGAFFSPPVVGSCQVVLSPLIVCWALYLKNYLQRKPEALDIVTFFHGCFSCASPGSAHGSTSNHNHIQSCDLRFSRPHRRLKARLLQSVRGLFYF